MTEKPYSIRLMNRHDMDVAISWAGSEGWNPGLHDADCFHAADPTGFFKGTLGDEVIATISAVKYGGSFGFIGLYIVKPAYRGQGYGLRLWKLALDTLKGRNIGLDAVQAQQENYKKFDFQSSYLNTRYEGVGTGAGAAAHREDLVDLSEVSFEALAAYDRSCFAFDRTPFLRCWTRQPGGAALGVWRHDRLAGYGVIRPTLKGYKIGPLFADDPSRAEALLMSLASRAAPGAPIYLDVPAINPAAAALAQKHGMKPVFETARMYTQKPPDLPCSRLFGVTTLELG